MLATLPINKGNKGLLLPSLPASQLRKAVTVIFPLTFIAPPPFQFFSHITFFQLYRYQVGQVGHPPSVNKRKKGPPLLSLCPFPQLAWTR